MHARQPTSSSSAANATATPLSRRGRATPSSTVRAPIRECSSPPAPSRFRLSAVTRDSSDDRSNRERELVFFCRSLSFSASPRSLARYRWSSPVRRSCARRPYSSQQRACASGSSSSSISCSRATIWSGRPASSARVPPLPTNSQHGHLELLCLLEESRGPRAPRFKYPLNTRGARRLRFPPVRARARAKNASG